MTSRFEWWQREQDRQARELREQENDDRGADHLDRCAPGCPCAGLRDDHAADVHEGGF